MKRYVVLDKKIGETPLESAEAWRVRSNLAKNIPLAYAGRLDPMASGKLLVLIGEECKRQENYHNLDKEYEFSVLLGASSDSGDVLGLITPSSRQGLELWGKKVEAVCRELTGKITLPYPIFSSRTVKGKPLHTWAVEGRLDEITIPTKESEIFKLKLTGTETKTGREIYDNVSAKIELIPPVTDPRKALGNDFRRPEVRAGWKKFLDQHERDSFTIAHFTCVASSGTYMRTLAEVIANKLNTVGLAYSIHRTKIGQYHQLPLGLGFWYPRYF